MTASRPLSRDTPAYLNMAQHPYRVYIEGIEEGSFSSLALALDSARTLASIFEGEQRRRARWWVENTMNGTRFTPEMLAGIGGAK